MTECPTCQNSLLEFEKWRFSKYGLYNEALHSAWEGNLLAALEGLAVFLNQYPEDRDANRLRLFVLYKLGDSRFDALVDEHIRNTNDKWAAEFQDNPESVTIDCFEEKVDFQGEPASEPSPNPAAVTLLGSVKNASELVETINGMYELYAKCRKLPEARRNRRTIEFLHFYEMVFMKYLHRADIYVIDYLDTNFYELSDDRQMLIGEVRPIRDKRKEPRVITRVYLPEIRFKNTLLQRARIEIVIPSSKRRAIGG